MPKFEQVKTEYATGHFMGTMWGSRIRVVMRSEESVIWVALGVHIARRKLGSGWHNVKTLCEKASRDQLSSEHVRKIVAEHFGEGAEDAILLATKPGLGTILVDGGGEPLPLPDHIARQNAEEEYNALTATRTDLIVPDRTCIQCGVPLRPVLDSHRLDRNPLKDPHHPRTVEDCQKLTNHPIFAVYDYGRNAPKEWRGFIEYFTTWDGESYVDEHFCSDRCALQYGRRAAALLPILEPDQNPPPRDKPRGDTVYHFEEEVRFTENGFRI